jgi:ribose 5-phosphate isomerase B
MSSTPQSGRPMRIALGCDEAAIGLADTVRAWLTGPEAPVKVELADFGVHCDDTVDYPDIAEPVALAVQRGEADRAVLLCGTGIGMAITANKVPGVRAACCHDTYSAERARKSNDAQVITMGARVIGPELALNILRTWLESEFPGGNSARKVAKISDLEGRYAVGGSGSC